MRQTTLIATSLVGIGLFVGAVLAPSPGFAQGLPAPSAAVVFESCPVYRDTDNGRKSGCWLADDPASGQRYDVSDSSSKPWVGRRMLVEGVPSQSTDVCGGTVLRPVRVSVLQAPCPELIIPAEGYPSKPSVLPKDFIQPTSVVRQKAAGPYDRKTFILFFDLKSDFFNYQESDTTLERAAHYAIDSNARAVHVQGFSDVQGFSLQGHAYAESAVLGDARRDKVMRALAGFGVAPAAIRRGQIALDAPETALGLLARRRVVITVEP